MHYHLAVCKEMTAQAAPLWRFGRSCVHAGILLWASRRYKASLWPKRTLPRERRRLCGERSDCVRTPRRTCRVRPSRTAPARASSESHARVPRTKGSVGKWARPAFSVTTVCVPDFCPWTGSSSSVSQTALFLHMYVNVSSFFQFPASAAISHTRLRQPAIPSTAIRRSHAVRPQHDPRIVLAPPHFVVSVCPPPWPGPGRGAERASRRCYGTDVSPRRARVWHHRAGRHEASRRSGPRPSLQG